MDTKKRKIFYFDRDGVINVDNAYVHKIDDFVFSEGIFDIMLYLKKLDYEFIIITNQSGINRGYYSQDDFHILNEWMKKEFKKKNIEFLEINYCPHTPQEKCECRKPKPFMINESATKWNVDMNNSFFIGDNVSDILAGKLANVKTIYLNRQGNFDNIGADYCISSLNQIKDIVLL